MTLHNRSPVKISVLRRTLLALIIVTALPVSATSFIYDGRLHDFGRPAEGSYDVRLTAYAAQEHGTTLAAPITFSAVPIGNGHFRLDFDAALAASDQAWLELEVRQSGDPGAFARIPGRIKAVAAPLVGVCWSSTGDTGVDPAINFLGTIDAQPLVLRTQNVQSLRIEPSAVLFGGAPNTTNTIAGSFANNASAGVRGATISGGGLPTGGSDPDFVSENPNLVTDSFGTVGGGFANTAGNGAASTQDASLATVAGGWNNTAGGLLSTIGGGESNLANGTNSFIGGGQGNRATSNHASVPGGLGNMASGAVSTVGGGENNCAGGWRSWAGGRSAKVRPASATAVNGEACFGVPVSGDGDGDNGSFVWADTSAPSDFVSTGANQFLLRSAGGMAINTNTPVAGSALTINGSVAISAFGSLSFASQARQMVNLWGPATYGIGVQNGTQYFRTDTNANLGSFAWFGGGSHNDAQFTSGGGALLALLTPPAVINTPNPTGTLRAALFVNTSDRAMKTGFSAVDGSSMLAKVLALPISEWVYRHAPDQRHVGPVAQDFRALFGLGGDDKSIATVDVDGVALAAIQGLNAKLEIANTQLAAENAVLRERMDRIEARLAVQAR